jgi:hypothetical protein
MYHRAIATRLEGHFAAPGVVDDLVRNDQLAGTEVSPDTTDRGHRYDTRDTDTFQGMHVGAVIHQMRWNRVAVAMAGKEDHILTTNATKTERTGRLAIRRAHHLAMRDIEICELRQAAAADDAKHENS